MMGLPSCGGASSSSIRFQSIIANDVSSDFPVKHQTIALVFNGHLDAVLMGISNDRPASG